MASQDSQTPSKSGSRPDGLLFGLALLVLVALMVASYFYPYPSGKRPDLWSLLLLWGREALILAAALVLLVVLAVGAIVKALKGSRGEPGASQETRSK
jgi:hypothetical protein